MPLELWGATELPRLALPQRPLVGYILLILYVLVLVSLLYRQRQALRRMSPRQWLGTVVLALASLTVSQLFPITLISPDQLPPLVATQNPEITLAVFSAIPFLFAGAALNPGAALIVGFAGGLGRALWRTHQIYDPFFFALIAFLAGWWMSQNYRGRLYRWLRLPALSGPLSLVLLAPALLPALYAYVSAEANSLAALDWSISTTGFHFLPLLLEVVVAGGVVAFIVRALPQLSVQPQQLVAAPQSRSVRNRLLVNFAVFAVLLSTVLVAIVFTFSIRVATQLSVNQMVHDAQAVSRQIPAFRTQTQNLLRQYSDAPALSSGDEEEIEAYLGQLVRTAGAFYRRVILVDAAGEVRAYYPARDTDEVTLTTLERRGVSDALARGAPSVSPGQVVGDQETVLSFVVPVRDEDGDAVAALVGRIPGIALNDLVVGLQGTVGEGSGFIVDERNQIIAHANESVIMAEWTPPVSTERTLRAKVEAPGTAYEGLNSETNARELVYYQQGEDHPWRVVITVPFTVVTRLALQISTPLIAVLAVAMLLFAGNLIVLGRGITNPLGELVEASQQLADGQWDVSVPVRESDEVGQLGHAFESMRRSMKRHFNEMSLMLDVSRDISASIDIQQGIPVILRGAVRGTGAAGVRAVVLNPNGRRPLTFGEGPAAEAMAAFDRRIASLGRQEEEFALTSPDQVRNGLRLAADQELPVHSMLAIALYAKDRFQGVIWLGYRQSHEFEATELSLLRTMANQASVLVENARLFATAEGQRRRLAAVLASTQDAVIVTDQTERVLLLNPAMARTFNLRPSKVIGRPVTEALENQNLVRALTEREERVRNMEIPVAGGRILYASVSTIFNNDRQVLGRVAVLHDITHLKELDEMKSEFVANVSHDLRGPITFMRGYLTMLPMAGELNDKQQEYLERTLSGVQQMSSIVEDLLDLGRIEAGVFLMQDYIEPLQLLNSVAEEMAGHAAAQDMRLLVEAAEDIPALYGDASLIRRAVANLVSNAVKYAPNSGSIVLRAAHSGDEVVFSVSDKGPGIAKTDQLRLFEKFYRVKKKGREDTTGSGLGLAIVKSIVERHGGRVWCRSAPGEGSTFYFSIPLGGSENG